MIHNTIPLYIIHSGITRKPVGAEARGQKKPEPDMELNMRWRDLSLKTICEEEEWKAQFEPIRDKFAKCLGLKRIFTDDNDPEDDGDRLGMFRSENNNPYCRSVALATTQHQFPPQKTT